MELGAEIVSGQEDGESPVGGAIVRADVLGTAAIVVAGALGAASDVLAKVVLVPVSAATGLIGIVTFVWSYFHAIGRSREHEISVSQLYAVAGTVAPKPVKQRLQWSLWAQVIAAIVVMVAGFSRTKPEQFNWAAVIIVVPMFGMGMNGAWVSLHGRFGPRIHTARPSRRARPGAAPAHEQSTAPKNLAESHDSTPGMKQNETHG